MTAIILSIGDELVLGQTVDTNSAWMSRELAKVGCAVFAHVTVPDDQAATERAIRESAEKCDYLLISGGIGPTPDDLTRQALAAVMGQPLEMSDVWLKRLEEFFAARGRPMPEMNRIQAMIPRGARMIDNCCGTAAGMHASLPRFEGKTCQVFVMPGVPKEMMAMFARDVLPVIRQNGGEGRVILSRTLHTFGLGESAVAEMLGDLMDRRRNPSVGTTVSGGVVSLRINARFDDPATAQAELAKTEAACHAALGDLIYGADEDTLAQVVSRMLMEEAGANRPVEVATAESCTGGLLAKMLTDISGSSAYFVQGWVTYANRAKMELLGVPDDLLKQHGAVSEPVAVAMAQGARERARSTYALAVTGIAGPTGGSPQKPVGTVCIALAHPAGCQVRTFHMFGDREMVRDRSCKMALTMLRFRILGKDMPC